MTYRGTVRNGVVEFDEAANLADGTAVRVEPVASATGRNGVDYGDLLAIAGSVEGLPADLARNHDHYLHGQPKK